MNISKLHYITQDLPNISHSEMARKALEGGVNWVQLRVKNKPYETWLSIAQEVKELCDEFGAKLIINDNVNIALAVKAAGVHLGKTDMQPSEARAILGNDFIIGGTANSMEDAMQLSNLPIDYIGLGPFRFTTTKENLAPVLGSSGIKNIVNSVNNIPIIAIGGIIINDSEELRNTGVHGIAISSAINLADDSTLAAKQFTTAWKN